MADAVLIAVRFVHFATAMFLFGASLFSSYAGVRVSERRWVRMALALAALLSALAWLDIEAIAISGDPAAWRSSAVIGKVMGHTEFGHIWRWRMGILVLLALAAGFANITGRGARAGEIAVTVLAGLAVATLAGIGHGAMGIGCGVWLHLGNQAIHMMAASVWVGGLMPLVRLVHRWPGDAVMEQALLRFSAAGIAAVALIVATGLVNMWFLVGSLQALVSSPYGRILTAKIAAVAAMVVLATVNRIVLLPRLRRGAGIRRALGHTVMAEQALALAAVALVSWLGTMMPPFGMGM